jgi:hypothetical protein
MEDTKQPVPLSAGIKAEISGVSRGTDVSLISLSVVCLLGTGGCFWLSTLVPLALIGSFIFLAGFCFVLYSWGTGSSRRSELDAPSAHFMVKGESETYALSLPLDSKNVVLKKILAQMRAIVQLRTPPPVPKGSVTGNPAEISALKEYSSDERDAIQNGWAKDIPKHDEGVVERLTSAIGALEGNAVHESEVTSEVPGMRQSNEPASDSKSQASS